MKRGSLGGLGLLGLVLAGVMGAGLLDLQLQLVVGLVDAGVVLAVVDLARPVAEVRAEGLVLSREGSTWKVRLLRRWTARMASLRC